MKIRMVLPVLLSLLLYTQIGWSQQLTPTGFYYPTGTNNPNTEAQWLASGCNGATDYLPEEYHLGHDIPASVGAPVYAIADGDIAYRSVNGWGAGNIALVIEHTLANDTRFLALYGHITSNLNVGDHVNAGQPFAAVGPWPLGSHLHFGIHPRLIMPPSNWGRMPCANWPSTNGFVEPITWIETETPDNQVDPLAQQAIQDMEARAGDDGRFGSTIDGTHSEMLDWHRDWELRWMDFTFTGGRIARIYHATRAVDTSERYTIFWDLDTQGWTNWVQAR